MGASGLDLLFTTLGIAMGLVACAVFAIAHDRHAMLQWIWALDADGCCASTGSWIVVCAIVLGAFVGSSLASTCQGRVRVFAWAVVWGLAAAASCWVTFGGHGGDGTNVMMDRVSARQGYLPLFVSGEMLGYLWYAAAARLYPHDELAALFMASRVAGWMGLAFLLMLANRLAAPIDASRPVVRGLAVSAICLTPLLILYGAYPQSTSLMLALVPAYLAFGLAALDPRSPRGRGHALGAGLVLAVACAAHGAAYFLGLSSLYLVVRCVAAQRFVRAAYFVGAFVVGWLALGIVEWHATSDSALPGWTIWSPHFALLVVQGQLHGPAGLQGASAWFGGTTYGEVLVSWVASVVPMAPVLAFVAALGAVRRPLGSGPWPRFSFWGASWDRLLFLGLSAGGCFVLWSFWDLWFGYPSDWDVTAITGLTIHTFVVAALLVTPWRRATLLALGFALPVQTFVMVHLARLFLGPPA